MYPLQGTSSHYSVLVGPMTGAPAPAADKPTAWWVWLLGGAIAVGLGVGGAVWYAGRADDAHPTRPPLSTTTATPVGSPTPGEPGIPIAPKLVEVRFDSLPSAGVFADGHSAELCRTPCAFNVDLADGGATDQRAFVVRVAGYQDKQVVVDLTAKHPELHVTLERSAGAMPGEGSSTGSATTAEIRPTPTPTPGHPTHPVRPGHPHRPDPVEPHTTAETKPEEIKPPVVEPKPEIKKPPVGTIDQSETLDPFHQKK